MPLLIAEPGSARAALAQARRLGRITTRHLRNAATGFDSLFEEIDLVELDDPLARRAGELAEVHRLRGYDAVHLAAADRIRDSDAVVIAGDSALLDAATAEGMSIAELPGPREDVVASLVNDPNDKRATDTRSDGARDRTG